MDPFAFVISLVFLIIAGGTVRQALSQHHARRELKGASPEPGQGELQRAVDDMSGRLSRLEEERDFYKDLLESPRGRRELLSPDTNQDPSDASGGS